jgi:pimeloyl-ACP methyl ester carboxylesterase
LILWGAKDPWVPVADAVRFQHDIRGSKLKIFDNLGHDPMEEDPKASAAVVVEFLDTVFRYPHLNPAPATTALSKHGN